MSIYRLYVVEDMSITRAALIQTLRGAGHEVTGSSPTAEKAFVEIPDLQPDVVILDLNLRGTKDGMWLAKKLRETMEVAIVFVTAYGGQNIVDQMLQVQADAYLMKPYNATALLGNIRLAHRRHLDRKTKSYGVQNDEIRFIKTRSGQSNLRLSQITYMMSQANYVSIHTEDQVLETRGKMDEVLAILDSAMLQRIHRRYAINIMAVTEATRESVSIAGVELPVSRSYSQELQDRLGAV